jgi:hypothetical protein
LLTRQVRHSATSEQAQNRGRINVRQSRTGEGMPARALRVVGQSQAAGTRQQAGNELRRQAWQWALANRNADGRLPSGEDVARAHGRKERWGRLVKNVGLAGSLGTDDMRLVQAAAKNDHDGAAVSSP